MRTIDGRPVIARYIGDQCVSARYIGENLVFADVPAKPDFIKVGLYTYFDAINNIGTGVHDPSSTVWVDLAGGRNGQLIDQCEWRNGDGLRTGLTLDSRVSFSGELPSDLHDYTVISIQSLDEKLPAHPYIYGVNPYPNMYAHSGNDYSQNWYGPNSSSGNLDTNFTPRTYWPTGTRTATIVRYSATTKILEHWQDGIYLGLLQNVGLARSVTTAYLGGRGNNERTWQGTICGFLLYTRALADDEIQHNFGIARERYQS